MAPTDGFTIVRGSATPMAHQAADVERLRRHPRINVWNELGTGKTMTTAWWIQSWWLAGAIDTVILVIPSMCMRDWQRTFEGVAWPDGLVDFIDARPPDHTVIEERLTARSRPAPGVLTVLATTYGGVRGLFAQRSGTSRWVGSVAGDLATGARGRGVAAVFDEAQGASAASGQAVACHVLASCSRLVASITATPIGNPLALRLWGMTNLVRPDILRRHPVVPVRGSTPPVIGTFDAFKLRYAVLRDPVQEKAVREGREAAFVPGRAYPVAVHENLIRDEILGPMAPFTVRRTKSECLDLPPKVRMIRSFELTGRSKKLMRDLIDDDRAVLESGRVVVPSNVLEERLRVLELCDGWVMGEFVHGDKVTLLSDVIDEVREAEGPTAPICVWGSRSRTIFAAAVAATGASVDQVSATVRRVFPSEDATADPTEYTSVVTWLRTKGVAIIHGPTPTRERDRIQDDWKEGRLTTVVAHPGVAGAGLNWQHVRATVYFSQPLGTIARQQSEDRVHRHGLSHTALYYDLVVSDGPDEAVAKAHAGQRDAELALLEWLRSRG